MVLNILIAVLIIVFVIIELALAKLPIVYKNAYHWWYMPWFALIYSVMMYLLYHYLKYPEWSLVNTWEAYQAEGVYFLSSAFIWAVISPILRLPGIRKLMIRLYRKLFAKNDTERNRAWPFPYFQDDNEVKARVGLVFYRWKLKMALVIVAVVYVFFFLMVVFASWNFYLISALCLFGLIPVIEYYIYLSADTPTEEVERKIFSRDDSDFDELWKLFVDTFGNYSVAWKRSNDDEDIRRTKQWEIDNDENFNKVMKMITNDQTLADGIVENCDIVTAFIKMEPFIEQKEKNGQHILIILDVPMHFTVTQEKSYTDQIAEMLSKVLKRNFNVYNELSTNDSLSQDLLIAPLSLLSRRGMDCEWMKKIGLVVVINLFDRCLSNLYESRKFCYMLNSVNEDYQIFYVTSYRRGMEPSTRNTWITNSQMVEVKMNQFPVSYRQFFIGYNFEDYEDRFDKIFVNRPPEPLYSGIEMAPVALSFKNKSENKVVTPVHYLELAYTNAIEGPEEFGRFSKLLDKRLLEVTANDINQNIKSHLLPVIQVVEKQVFAVIFDQDNNAPAVYSKWVHLGYRENFSIVISKPYMFRDYFNANHAHFVLSPFAALQPHLCKSRITLAIILLSMLKEAHMEEQELRVLLRGYFAADEINSVPSLLKKLFSTYFSSNLANMLKTVNKVKFDGNEYVHQTFYWLAMSDNINLPYLDVVTVEDESGNELFEILYDLMYQNYGKGQLHSFNGKPFIIGDYDKKEKILKVKSRNTKEKEVAFYRPSVEVSLSGNRVPIEDLLKSTLEWKHRLTNEQLSISVEGFESKVTVDTKKWFAFTKYTVFDCSYSSDNCPPKRVYSNGKVLKVTFKFFQKAEYLEKIDDIRKSLQLLIYESMQSLFPHHAQYLIVASEGEGDDDLEWIFNRFTDKTEEHKDEHPLKNELTYYFIEDAHVDLGLIGALTAASEQDNIWYLLKYIYDYLTWLTEGDPIVPGGYEAYLNRRDGDKLAFLKYGRDNLPSYFNTDLLINFIRDYYKHGDLQKIVNERQSKDAFMGICDFCGNREKNCDMQRLDDGRMRCSDCSDGAVDTEEQFKKICDEVQTMFLTHLNIDFKSIPHTGKLISAVELHKTGGYPFSITNGYDVREIVGLACDRKLDEFYVENGYKPDKTFGIIAHEMTHIWEYNNEDFKKIKATNEDWVEGLAVWTDLFLSEKEGLDTMEERKRGWLARDDEYGRGLKLIMDNCPDNPYEYIREKAKKL